MLVHLFGKWHARRWISFQQIRKLINLSCTCVISLLVTKESSKEKIDKCLSNKFYGKKSARTRKTLKDGINHAIALIMLYENRKPLIFKVLGVVLYCFNGKYVCVNYFCLQIEAKLSLNHWEFKYTSFDDFSGIGITECLSSIVSCYDYIKYNSSTMIFKQRIKLVSYYPSKGFLIIEKIKPWLMWPW